MNVVAFCHEAGLVPGVQNGLAQLAGGHLPAPGAPVIRAFLMMAAGPDDWLGVPVGGDEIQHYTAVKEGWPPEGVLGRSEVLEVLRMDGDGERVTIGGHEASWVELQEMAEGLGYETADRLMERLRSMWGQAEEAGRRRWHAVVVCW